MSRHLFILLAFLAFTSTSLARFVRVEVEKVPVDRITKNLEEIVKKDPKNAGAILNLGRAHAMAYALRSDEVQVNKKSPDVVWFNYTPPIVPFREVTPTDDKARLAAARVHLDAAIKNYAAAVTLTPDDLRAQLGYGWLLTQADKKDEAIAVLRKAIAKAWETEQKLSEIGFGNNIVSIEGAEYLAPLLDPEKDKAEIATLTDRAAKLKKMPRIVTPIAIPLRDGMTAAQLENRDAAVSFDADGLGARKWTWIGKDAAWLVHDPKATGKVTSGLQFFGNVTFWMFWETGYNALAALDDNHDGQLTGSELAGLSLWHDANGNGVCDAGEVRPVGEHGIVAISCRFLRDANHSDRIAYSSQGVTFRDGHTRPTFDLVLHPAK